MTSLVPPSSSPSSARSGSASSGSVASPSAGWHDVCAADEVPLDRGVAALLDGNAVAIFQLSAIDDGQPGWYAVSHTDPATGALVMARGLVGSASIDGREVDTVASPLHKQRYDLGTGRCLDAPDLSLRCFPIEVVDGRVRVMAVLSPG